MAPTVSLAKMASSKFEANPLLHLRVRRSFFSLFPLASSFSHDYFRTYAIIDFITNQLVFANTVTYTKYENYMIREKHKFDT